MPLPQLDKQVSLGNSYDLDSDLRGILCERFQLPNQTFDMGLICERPFMEKKKVAVYNTRVFREEDENGNVLEFKEFPFSHFEEVEGHCAIFLIPLSRYNPKYVRKVEVTLADLNKCQRMKLDRIALKNKERDEVEKIKVEKIRKANAITLALSEL